jgi:hypothetical protein
LDARDRCKQGLIPPEALRLVEDEAIRDIVRFQEELGLQGITDGDSALPPTMISSNNWQASRRVKAPWCTSTAPRGK